MTIDGQRCAWILGSDLVGGVETPSRAAWVVVNSSSVTIRNFAMRYASTAQDNGAINGWGVSHILVTNNNLSYTNNGVLVGIGGGPDLTITHNDLGYGGQFGADAANVDGLVFSANKLHDNNTANVSWTYGAGGLKWTGTLNGTSSIVMDSNDVYNNNGAGLWCDAFCINVTFSNNRVHNNLKNPLMFEISSYAYIYGNDVWDCGGWGGIVVSSSGHADVHNNLIVRTNSINVLLESRNAPSDAGTYDTIHDNNLVSPSDGLSVNWYQESPGTNGNTDVNNVILTGQAATNALNAAGIPLSP